LVQQSSCTTHSAFPLKPDHVVSWHLSWLYMMTSAPMISRQRVGTKTSCHSSWWACYCCPYMRSCQCGCPRWLQCETLPVISEKWKLNSNTEHFPVADDVHIIQEWVSIPFSQYAGVYTSR
jgi:hypothetical protein